MRSDEDEVCFFPEKELSLVRDDVLEEQVEARWRRVRELLLCWVEYDRQFWDSPAEQGKWESRQFTAYSQDLQIPIGTSELYFTNIMEYDNGTMPLDPDSDGDSVAMKPVFTDGVVSDYVMDLSLSDGLELFKYGTNPLDNDTDGDMMPDFYEHQRGWNETTITGLRS